MDSNEYLGWCEVENTISERLIDNSLAHTFSSKSHIKRSTKLINQELKKLYRLNTYSQYIKCKKKILGKITENKDVTDESDLSDDDYKNFYNSFEISSKKKSETDVGEEAFVWSYVEKQGRKKVQPELHDSYSNVHFHQILEPNIDISVIENISNPVEKPSLKQEKVNNLIVKQTKAKSCSPHKSTTKHNIKNVISASTSKIDNVNIKLSLKKETRAQQSKETQCSEIKKSVDKSPKSVKRNLTSVINDVSRKTSAASEGEDWNDEFIPSDFQAQSTQIFTDTLSVANTNRKSVNRQFSQNEVVNQPRDSGIEEDSREENVSINKKPESILKADHKIQENLTPKKINNRLGNHVNNAANNSMKCRLPLKIIGEETVTTKYKIVSNKDFKPIVSSERPNLKPAIANIEEISKTKPQSSSDSNSEYMSIQNGNDIDNSKQETEESSDEYYDLQNEASGMDSDNEMENKNFKKIKSPINTDDPKVNKVSEYDAQLFTEESSEENSEENFVRKKLIKNNKNKQAQKTVEILNKKSDNEITSNTVNLRTSPKNKKNKLTEKSEETLKDISDCEQSYEIEPQQDLSDIIKNYKKLHKSVDMKNNNNSDSEDSEKSKNMKTTKNSCKFAKNNKDEKSVIKQTKKQLTQIKKIDHNEESSESEDEAKKEHHVKYIFPDIKSNSKDSEESEIETTAMVLPKECANNEEEEENILKHTQKQLSQIEKLDLANDEESSESEAEVKKNPPIKYILPNKKSDSEESEESEIETITTIITPKKCANKEEEEEIVSEQTQKRLLQIKKLDLVNDEESSESEDEVKKNPPIKYILPSKKSDSEDSEESEIETTAMVLPKECANNGEEEENILKHTQMQLSQIKKLNLANDEESSESEDEVNKNPPIKYILPNKKSDSEESEESEIETTTTIIPPKKCANKEEEEEIVPEQTQKRLLQIKKLDLTNDEESSESEDEVKEDPPIKYILPDIKSDSEESEESEIETTTTMVSPKECANKEEEIVPEQTQKRLLQIKKLDLANDEESSESEDEVKKHPPIKYILPDKKSDSEQSEESEIETTPVFFQSKKRVNDEEGHLSIQAERRLAEMKRIDFANFDDSEDSEEENYSLPLKNIDVSGKNSKNQELENSSNSDKEDIEKNSNPIKNTSFKNNDIEESDTNESDKLGADDIDIEEHKVIMPEGYQEPELPELMEYNISCDSSMERTKSKTEKTSKFNKKNKLIGKEAVVSQKIDKTHYNEGNESIKNDRIANKKSNIRECDQDADVDSSSSKTLMQSNNIKRIQLNNQSDEESDVEEYKEIMTQSNKINMKLLNNKDNDSDSDRSMSPSTSHRLSQFKKMNLIDKDSSSSSSEDEENHKNEVLSNKIESHNFKSDDSDEEKSEKPSKSDIKFISDYPGISEKNKNNKNVIINETQESADSQKNYIESQEMFSSLEDLTERQNKESVLENNEQKIDDEISSTPEPTDLIRERITNITQLIKKENLLPVSYESTMASNNLSPEEEIFLLEVPKNVFSDNLIGEQFLFSKTTLKVGCNTYEAFKRKAAPTISCIFQSEHHKEDLYETINIRPAVSIVARRKKLVDELNEPFNKEKPVAEDTKTKSKSAKKDSIELKKKETKTKNTIDSETIKTPKNVNLLDTKIESDRKKKAPRKEDIQISPKKTKKSDKQKSVDSPSVTENKELINANETIEESLIKYEKKEKTFKEEYLKKSPKKSKKSDATINKENVGNSTDIKNKIKMSKETNLINSSNKINKKEKKSKSEKSQKKKFRISQFVQTQNKINTKQETKVKRAKDEVKIEEEKVVQWKDNAILKRKLSALCDNDSDTVNENNRSLSPPFKKQKLPIRDTTNASEEDEKQVKFTIKNKSKSKIKKVKDGVIKENHILSTPKSKSENNFKVTKLKKNVADNNDVFAEIPMISFKSEDKFNVTNLKKTFTENDDVFVENSTFSSMLKLKPKNKTKVSKLKKINNDNNCVSVGASMKSKPENKLKVPKLKKAVDENNDVLDVVPISSTSNFEVANKSAKVEVKKSSKKRKLDNQPSDLNVVEEPTKKKKTDLGGEKKTKRITKAAKAKMQMQEKAELRDTLFSLFRKTMKCDLSKTLNNSSSNLDKSKYSPLELEFTSNKKSRLDVMSSSSSDEYESKCANRSFKMREKPKPEVDDSSSNSSCDFIPSSQNAFKREDKKKPKIFFNE